MTIRRLIACCLLSLCLMSAARATQPISGYFGGFFPGFGYNIYGMESIPYYALHPPVYYSQPVPRTYGWSPFAYPPGTLTPEVEVKAAQPQVYRNPYVKEQADDDNVAMTARPLRILNPYVESAGEIQLSRAGDEQ